MELALYCPECGFYEKEGDNVGRGGDFYTSVSVGPLFGELLAFQFDRWLGESRIADCGLRIVEAGAHDGKLAADVLGWFQRQRPESFARLDYCILEPSVRRREWQQKSMAEFSRQVRWLDDFADPPSASGRPCFTIVFSNELLDAMPVRRFGWDAVKREWFEWGVTTESEHFVWSRLPLRSSSSMPGLSSLDELQGVLPDGYTVEFCPAAERWWGEVANRLRHGKLLTFDYGLAGEEVISPQRLNGTVRAYRNHSYAENVLADPGEQDITAHVNFSRIEAAGIAMGLTSDVLETQGRFLTRVAAGAWKLESGFGEWDQKRTRQFQTLTHPQHLGQSFRVLVQSRR